MSPGGCVGSVRSLTGCHRPSPCPADAQAQAVLLSDGQVVAFGDRVSGGGGYPYLSDLGTELAEPLALCPTNKYGEVAMFNAGEQITVTK